MPSTFAALSLVATLTQTTPVADQWPCHFTAPRVVGCFAADPEDFGVAVEMYRKFGLNSELLQQQTVKEALAQYGCRVIVTGPNSHWKLYARGPLRVATLDGAAETYLMDLRDVGQILMIDGHYLAGKCPLPPPVEGSH